MNEDLIFEKLEKNINAWKMLVHALLDRIEMAKCLAPDSINGAIYLSDSMHADAKNCLDQLELKWQEHCPKMPC